jgi:hypothetical protein
MFYDSENGEKRGNGIKRESEIISAKRKVRQQIIVLYCVQRKRKWSKRNWENEENGKEKENEESE